MRLNLFSTSYEFHSLLWVYIKLCHAFVSLSYIYILRGPLYNLSTLVIRPLLLEKQQQQQQVGDVYNAKNDGRRE